MNQEDRKALLDKFFSELNACKTHFFRMQDAAMELGDPELCRRVQEARDWIESSDRRATEVRDDSGWRGMGRRYR